LFLYGYNIASLLELGYLIKILQRKGNNLTNTIKIIQNELPSYAGLTSLEKQYGLSHLDEWIPENGRLEILIQKFSEKSLDIRPFLQQIGVMK